MALQVFPSATSKSWDPCHETQKRRRQQDLQIARKPLHSISYLNKKICYYFCYRVMIAGFDKTPMNSWDSEWTFLGLERDFEWSKTAWIFHPHRVTSYFWWLHNPSQISPKRILEFLRTNKLNDVSKVEIGDLNIGDYKSGISLQECSIVFCFFR